jgi:preprotein translocase subunit SecA
MTVNDYLSKRDYEITRPLYMFYGFRVDCIEYYEHFTKERRVAYMADIVFGTNSGFVFDYLYDHIVIDPKMCVQGKHNYAVVDEMDSILIDEANNPHIISGGDCFNQEKMYKEYAPIIKDLLRTESGKYYTVNDVRKDATLTNCGKQWLSEKLKIEGLFDHTHRYDIEGNVSLSDEQRKQFFEKLTIQNTLKQLLLAYTVYEKDVDYVVDDSKIKIIDPYTGRIRANTRWEYGLHTAVEVKESVDVQNDSTSMAVISLKNYFKLYNKVCGMSGTILSAKDEFMEVYGLKCAQVPTHVPVVRKDEPLQIFRTEAQKNAAVLDKVYANYNVGRPTLIGCLSLKQADVIGELLSQKALPFNRLDARTTKEESLLVAKAGLGNTITLSTSIAGRGTDIKPDEDALCKGGLSVVGTDLFASVRTDQQLKGRTGRQGNVGSSTFFVSLEDVILKYLNADQQDELKNVVATLDDKSLSNDEVRRFFELAQGNRENLLKEQRAETARKDDIIAPHRKRFYDRRNSVLFGDAGFVRSIVEQLLKKKQKDRSQLEKRLMRNYEIVKDYFVKRNDSDNRKVKIPVSCPEKEPFIVELESKMVLRDSTYFLNEFQRQVVLKMYDRYWTKFVQYVELNLDEKEVRGLEGEYDKMKEDMEDAILSRLFYASIPYSLGEKRGVDGTFLRKWTTTQKTPSYILLDSLCPCGSGRKYCECHGRNIRNIPRRR